MPEYFLMGWSPRPGDYPHEIRETFTQDDDKAADRFLRKKIKYFNLTFVTLYRVVEVVKVDK